MVKFDCAHRSVTSSSQSQAFKDIVYARHSAKEFSDIPVPDKVTKDIMELTVASPSSFNMQPYKLILIKSTEIRNLIADEAMLGSNKRKVKSAPLTVVFVAHKGTPKSLYLIYNRKLTFIFSDAGDLVEKVVQLETRHGTNPEYLKSLPYIAEMLLRKKGFFATKLKQLVSELRSPLVAMPTIAASADAWAAKNAGIAAQTLMLAATAHGLDTCCMEGFDERRLCSILSVPTERFSVPLLVSVGYPLQDATQPVPKKIRFTLEDMCFIDKYGTNFEHGKN